MPINLNYSPPGPPSALGPDVGPNDHILFPTSISQEEKLVIPANFDQLSEAEQNDIKMKIRYGGIRCRNDLTNQIPVSGQTLDL
jgi:hypothetical protein